MRDPWPPGPGLRVHACRGLSPSFTLFALQADVGASRLAPQRDVEGPAGAALGGGQPGQQRQRAEAATALPKEPPHHVLPARPHTLPPPACLARRGSVGPSRRVGVGRGGGALGGVVAEGSGRGPRHGPGTTQPRPRAPRAWRAWRAESRRLRAEGPTPSLPAQTQFSLLHPGQTMAARSAPRPAAPPALLVVEKVLCAAVWRWLPGTAAGRAFPRPVAQA